MQVFTTDRLLLRIGQTECDIPCYDCDSSDQSDANLYRLSLQENLKKFREGKLINVNNEIRLLRSAHAMYLTTGLSSVLPRGFITLDARYCSIHSANDIITDIY